MPENIKISSSKMKFKSFNDTFPYCAFALAVSLLYPNKKVFRGKVIIFTFICIINSFMIFWFFTYLIKCIYALDMYNVSRNVTIGILISLFFVKYFYVMFKTDKFSKLLQNITDDLLRGNTMEQDYQEIYEEYIKLGKMGQRCWIVIPILLSSQFPLYAVCCMIYENIISDDGKRYMVHEMEMKYIEDKQYVTPYYELLFAYNLSHCVILSLNFAGLDGSFCIATTHMQLKLKLVTHKVHRAFADAKDRVDLERRVKEAIKDHQTALMFYDNLQDMYGGWLFTVFLVSAILISMNLYQIHLSNSIDPKYTIFAISGVVHMFAPCYFASNLIKSSEDMSTELYNVSWEVWSDPVVTKLLIFMIAKSQQRLLLSGKGVVYFNMQLFISVMQSSYSFFTLISR